MSPRLFVRAQPPRRTLLGLAVTLAGVTSHPGVTFFAGTVIAGGNFGAGFNGSLRSLVAWSVGPVVRTAARTPR